MMILNAERLAALEALHLESGAHKNPDFGMCAMEAAAWIAGENHSDHPACVCPILGAFVRAWNDGLLNDERDAILKPIIPRLIGTRSSKALRERRALMAADWLVRVNTPAWLRLAKLDTSADALAALPEITAFAQVPSIRGPIETARENADAAGAAAGVAAWAAARAAARAAAWAAAGDAAGVAVGAAAGAAAWAATGAALKETRLALQRSAAELVSRMIDANDAT
jgi:hypothetical protein